jgi:hypothetical protein
MSTDCLKLSSTNATVPGGIASPPAQRSPDPAVGTLLALSCPRPYQSNLWKPLTRGGTRVLELPQASQRSIRCATRRSGSDMPATVAIDHATVPALVHFLIEAVFAGKVKGD